MPSLQDINSQNFVQLQNQLPQLRSFAGLEGFAQQFRNPDANQPALQSLLGQIQSADLSGGFVAGGSPEADFQFLINTGQVAPSGTGGLFEQSDFSQFGVGGNLDQRAFDAAVGQTRRFTTEQVAGAGLLSGSTPEQDFLANLFREVTLGGTAIGDLTADFRTNTNQGSFGPTIDDARRQALLQQFQTFATQQGLAEGSGFVNPFAFGGTAAQSGDIVRPHDVTRTIGPDTLDPTADAFQQLLQQIETAPDLNTIDTRSEVNPAGGGGIGGGGRINPLNPDAGFRLPSGGGSFGGSFGGGGGGFGGGVNQSLEDFFQGRQALVSQGIEDLAFRGPSGVQNLLSAVPELGAAATVAAGAFGGDMTDDFTQALQEAAAVRGLDPGQVGQFNAGLAANRFLGSAAQLATQTGFEDLLFAGFAPPQNISFGTIGSLNMQQAELSAQIQSGLTQSMLAQQQFNLLLPGLLSPGA